MSEPVNLDSPNDCHGREVIGVHVLGGLISCTTPSLCPDLFPDHHLTVSCLGIFVVVVAMVAAEVESCNCSGCRCRSRRTEVAEL